MRECVRCSKEFGHRGLFCRSCVTNKRKTSVKHKAVAYLGGACKRCGYNKSIHALEFHHLNPEEKSFNISGSHCRAWRHIQAELDKCELLCSNCHKEVEYQIIAPIV